MSQTILSLDIFDTLLVRVVARPEDAFLLVGQLLLREGLIDDPAQYAQARIDAETQARQNSTREEVTLDEILRTLVAQPPFQALDAGHLKAVETSVELALAQPVRHRVDQLATASGCVVLASDMYLDTGIVRQLVDRVLALSGRSADYQLYVSAEHGVTKNSGALYRRIADDIPEYLTNAAHAGDRRYADCVVPRRLGINAEHETETVLNRYESAIAGGEDDRLFRSLLAGSMRAARLANPHSGAHQCAVWNYGCSVVAPVVLLYTHWVLRSAQADGIQRLAFLSRDGQIMWQVASLLAAGDDAAPVCRYVYASRQAWNLPSVVDAPADLERWAYDQTDFLSIGSFAGRIGLDAQELMVESALAGVNPDENLTAAQRQKLFDHVRGCERVQRLIEAAAHRQRQSLLSYFREQGVFDAAEWAIVDVGWRGRLQDALERVLSTTNGEFCVSAGYYFGLRDPVPSAAPRRQFYRRNPRVHRAWVEHLFAATHGSVIGFQSSDAGQVVAQFLPPGSGAARDWGVAIQHQAVLKVTALLITALRRFDVPFPEPDTALSMTESVMDLAFSTPGTDEAQLFSALSVHEDQLETHGYPLVVQKVGWRAIFRGAVLARPFVHGNEWQEASVALQSSGKRMVYHSLRNLRRGVGTRLGRGRRQP